MSKDSNKNSFVLYNDLIHSVNKLNDQQAGQLFKAILKHANGQEAELNNLMLELVFTPIKLQLNRDSEKWEKERILRSESGKKGGAPKGNKNAAKFKTTSKQPKNNLKQPKQPKQPKQAKQANGCISVNNSKSNSYKQKNEVEKTTKQAKQAKQAVNVNVNVNDTVNVNVNDKIKMPFDSKNFNEKWIEWKTYKKQEHNFKYKSEISEQKALNQLDNISKKMKKQQLR
jgi:hypothetical protein